MPRFRLFSASFALLALAAVPAYAAPLPTLPGTAPATESSDAGGARVLGDEVRRGIVQIEQAGRPLAVGTVLAKDGRVLTSLSALGANEQLEIRFLDNSVVKARIGHKDKTWDLALLVPLGGASHGPDGLMPTDADPQAATLVSYLPKAGKLSPMPVNYKGRVDARSAEAEALKSALEVEVKGAPVVLGAPLVDENGRVLGVMVKACKEAAASAQPAPKAGQPAAGGGAACSPLLVAAPVYALRGFLMKTPQSAAMPSPWLGLGGAPTAAGNVHGVQVMGLAPGSPAEKAGLKAGGDNPDTIVAVDGQPVESPEQLAEVIAKRAIGQQVKLLVFSAGKFREVPVTLRANP